MKHLENIEKHEANVQAFVEDTFYKSRILVAESRVDQSLPLAGLLLGVKDIIHVDGFQTRCGSDLPANLFSGDQASCVTRLINAGAVMAGKTVTAEFAVSDPGPTRNPRNLNHTPGGSSSGSAAAVAAGFCDIALGTQTSGSVIRPAGYCGVVGYKPSFGRVSLDGVLPFSTSMDHIGLMASDIPMLGKVLPVLVPDWQTGHHAPTKNLTIGVPQGSYINLAAPNVLNEFEKNLSLIERSGVRLKHIPLCDDVSVHNDNHDLIANAELYRIHEPWFAEYQDLYKPKSRETLEFGKKISDQTLQQSLGRAKTTQLWMQEFMKQQAIDVWLAPVAPDLAPEGLSSTGDFRMNAIWSYTGLPVITFPTGADDRNLPYSVQIAGRFGQDEALLQIAQTLNELIGVGDLPLAWDLN